MKLWQIFGGAALALTTAVQAGANDYRRFGQQPAAPQAQPQPNRPLTASERIEQIRAEREQRFQGRFGGNNHFRPGVIEPVRPFQSPRMDPPPMNPPPMLPPGSYNPYYNPYGAAQIPGRVAPPLFHRPDDAVPDEAPRKIAFEAGGLGLYCDGTILDTSRDRDLREECSSLPKGTEYVPLENPWSHVSKLSGGRYAFCDAARGKKSKIVDTGPIIPAGKRAHCLIITPAG